MELRAYARACRRRWLWLLIPVLLSAGIAAGLALSAPAAYRSSMILFASAGGGDPDAEARRLNSYIALLTGPRVAQGVVARLGSGQITADEVRQSLSAQVSEGTDLLEIAAVDPSAARSREIVTTAATVLVTLAKQITPANPDGTPAAAISILQDAETTRQPGNLARNTGFAAVLGLLLGAIAVAIREAAGRTVAEEDDLRRLGLGTVGVISLDGRHGRGDHPDQTLAEAFRRLRSVLPGITDGARGNPRGRALLLAGPGRKEGTTAVSCGLAIALAETGARVVLVDANLRTPGIGRYLSLDPAPGLAEVLAGSARVPDVLHESLNGRLTVLPAGEQVPDPGGLLASPRLPATVRSLTEQFDVVLLDAPPLNGPADAAVLGRVTDSALLVVRAGRTRTADVEKSVELLTRIGAKLAGAVLNALPRKLPTGEHWATAARVAPADELIPLEEPEPAIAKGVVRGRARVVKAALAGETSEPEEPTDGE
ncbi:receptor protein-tyrosine kinase [Actinoplanes sp. SE50]|uniref:polysaccharide biosynthesis tyrosine autokinase n=1 Tax=unclassified Actinoplanes TaxID=2626549 RepID=UPI00023ECA02|nr:MULTISPECIES: polysaccharide biosynthesis tyrosine autokinase [unclassified Actinoplanes]AEV86526.1 receptor protein-tyrosine kinase [Actinoplanes sp. SE50/110]ATO84924.1 receptor protein-tyrosine kinase [Actinoplanes sp. SE50]SLM02333.1 receptor protein-tyrosine kinase [Actinoplanes sp. SE50/110]